MSDLGDAYSEVAVEWGEVDRDVYADVCDVKRKTASGGTVALSTIHPTVPCDVKALSGGKDLEAIRAKTTYLVEMPGAISGTTLNTTKSEDLLTVAMRGLQPARTYKVIDVSQDRGIKVFARCTIES